MNEVSSLRLYALRGMYLFIVAAPPQRANALPRRYALATAARQPVTRAQAAPGHPRRPIPWMGIDVGSVT
jgi:hypothetical protein